MEDNFQEGKKQTKKTDPESIEILMPATIQLSCK
jgi:hypothetical protein